LLARVVLTMVILSVALAPITTFAPALFGAGLGKN
jgi:hypothetical protein